MITNNMKIAVIALNDGTRVADVATLCGTSTAQIKKWTELSEFKKERYLDMTERFGNLAGEALNTLREVMNNTDARGADRIKASTEILNRAGFIVQQSVNFTITDTERSGEFKMSLEEIQSMRDEVKQLLTMRDVTPVEEMLQIEEDIEREELIEEVEESDGEDN